MERLLEYWYVFLIVFIGFLIFFLFASLSPMLYIARGNYPKAIARMERLLNTEAYRKKPTLNIAIMFNIANCYNRMGDLRKSLGILDKIDLQRMNDPKLRFSYNLLYAANLFLLEADIEEAILMMDKAKEILYTNETFPLFALSESWKENNDKALEYLHHYQPQIKGKGKFLFSAKDSTLVYDRFTLEVENNYFIALAYLKMGMKEQAFPYLKAVGQAEYPNYYSEKAEEVLKG